MHLFLSMRKVKIIHPKRNKMKLTRLLSCLFLCIIGMSCIQDEAQNAEADIEDCIVPADILRRDPIITNDKVTLMVKADTDLSKQSPEFTLTPGATISPASGTTRDFSEPQYYTVTSEDGNWKKRYEVTYIVTGIGTEYNFENVKHAGTAGYDVFYETDKNGNTIMDWASGNPGFALTDMNAKRDTFPTLSSSNGYKGNCVKLVTRSTGDFGSRLGMPIAAGNLFMGTFDILSAVTNALKATKFGMPFEYVPTYLTGYYKHKAGPEFSESGKIVSGKKDMFDIYAIFYETTDNVKMLDGTNKFTHPNLISIARIEDPKETDEWTQFYLPFKTQPGKTIDRDKLKAGKYNVAIVFSSSVEGDLFNGAVGSTLYIDEVELIHSLEE